MILASIDLNKESLEEFLFSLDEIRDLKFDGVEICLWEDMTNYIKEVKEGLKKADLKSNVHNDIMRIENGLESCQEKINSSLRFSKGIGANFFISHPIKPYSSNLQSSKELFDRLKEEILIETVQGIRLEEIKFLNRPIVLDIGNLIKNGEYDRLAEYNNIRWLHIHDVRDGQDPLPFGEGELDLNSLVHLFPNTGFTIEIGNRFRKWEEISEGYRVSIDSLNNSLIFNKSYGKNVRLKHLLDLVGDKSFRRAIDLGCGEGYLLHNLNAKDKIGYDRNPKSLFNDITYHTIDINDPLRDYADIVICSEVIEHMENDRNVIRNVYNLLKPKGIVFLSTISRNTLEDKSNLDKVRGHYRRYGKELEKIMENQGFKTLSFYPFRSKYYYDSKGSFSEYDTNTDIQQGRKNASGWIYFGLKE